VLRKTLILVFLVSLCLRCCRRFVDVIVCAASVEAKVVPRIGAPRVPSSTIKVLARCLQEASRLYDLDLPHTLRELPSPPMSPPATSSSSSLSRLAAVEENRFSTSLTPQAREAVVGTTAEIVPRPRERLAYRSFDLLFSLCDRRMTGKLTIFA
jgi:hypothetical protein